jgi:hypothetical protein
VRRRGQQRQRAPGSGTAGRWAGAAWGDGGGGARRRAEASRRGDGGGSAALAEAPGAALSRGGWGDGGGGVGHGDSGAPVSGTVARRKNSAA